MSEIRQDLQNRILIRLAGNIVDVELGPPELEEAVRTTLAKFRQLSSNSVEEAHIFLEMQESKTEYILPDQVIEVREVFRRGLGRTQGGVTFDPFNAAFTNFYLLESGRQGGLATFRLFTEYQELIGTLFGEHIMFNWRPNEHRLEIIRNIRGPETVLLWVYLARSDDEIIKDLYAESWIIDYCVASSKIMLGEGRGKFSQIVGPQGGTTLNGDQIKNEGISDQERLEREVMEMGSGEEPLGLIIG